MKFSGWGRYPSIDAEVIHPLSAGEVVASLADRSPGATIARGLGRSYGDSSLAPRIISTSRLDHFIRFDETTGILTCAAGLSLADILEVIVPRGWFLPVTPGTKFVTVGGAIASDVHGKNHHLEGSFTDYVRDLKIATASDGIVQCSREQHPALFHATCGGMGLTGIVLEATLALKTIKSAFVNETTIKAGDLEELLALFEEYQETTYSVAWIDCLSTGKSLGRALLMLGEHAESGALETGKGGGVTVPVDMPGLLLNTRSVRAFNALYYHRVLRKRSKRRAHYDPFFYPLDGIQHWNRLYGKNGFTQYQFVLPKDAGLPGVASAVERIARSGRGSFLAVIKAFGRGNDNYLSFPMEGYTLSLDFKIEKGLFELLDELDGIVLHHGGRLYLAKDARMSGDVFRRGYPLWDRFAAVRERYGADRIFHSLQSQRLGL